MNTEFTSESAVPQSESSAAVEAAEEAPKSTSMLSSGEATQQKVQQIWEKVSGLLGDLPDYVTDFFKSYRRPIITVALIIAAIVSVKLVLAILGAVNDVPLLSPTFELIGLTYSGWFVYRYLLRAASRKELIEDFNALKDQVLGKHS